VPSFFQVKTYCNYWLDSVNEHSLHSPFLFDLYTKVIKLEANAIPEIENLRLKLLDDQREIEVHDLGAGSTHQSGSKRKISDIAGTSMSDATFASLYLRLAKYCKAKTIVELGTCLGITTLYLAKANGVRVYTFEGSENLCDIAELSFEFSSAKNIELIKGNIDSTLYTTLSRIPKIDLAFMDANHRYEPTLKYFETLLPKIHHGSIVVLDDIHDNPEMERAWRVISRHELVYVSIDLYRCGILFFDPSLNKQHVVLHF
jgi:predicted O-methyltransferase YrrM